MELVEESSGLMWTYRHREPWRQTLFIVLKRREVFYEVWMSDGCCLTPLHEPHGLASLVDAQFCIRGEIGD